MDLIVQKKLKCAKPFCCFCGIRRQSCAIFLFGGRWLHVAFDLVLPTLYYADLLKDCMRKQQEFLPLDDIQPENLNVQLNLPPNLASKIGIDAERLTTLLKIIGVVKLNIGGFETGAKANNGDFFIRSGQLHHGSVGLKADKIMESIENPEDIAKGLDEELKASLKKLALELTMTGMDDLSKLMISGEALLTLMMLAGSIEGFYATAFILTVRQVSGAVIAILDNTEYRLSYCIPYAEPESYLHFVANLNRERLIGVVSEK